jgi:hypothetical protein
MPQFYAISHRLPSTSVTPFHDAAGPHDHIFAGSTTGEHAARFRVQSHDPHDGQCESPCTTNNPPRHRCQLRPLRVEATRYRSHEPKLERDLRPLHHSSPPACLAERDG